MSSLLNILCIDSSTEACSVAVQTKSAALYHHFMLAPREHTQKILPTIESVINEAQLTLSDIGVIVYGQGPGSFTGVRIGISIAQGLAYGLEVNMVGVSTLQAMSQQAFAKHQCESVYAAIDARMGEVYFAHYINQNGLMVLQENEVVVKPEQLVQRFENDQQIVPNSVLVGTGWEAYSELSSVFTDAIQLDIIYPDAAYMIEQAVNIIEHDGSVEPELAIPVYLRDTVTWKKLPGRE